ncbi:GNAT acetyltransferase [Clostridium cavendishii DSM 21758]|uniref:GNAT acetyltransferase n=1 Tax=Clostridium cavendishii DSM 21758 TaxID=1121302 RepID=A0A1M6R2B8_9CLOT|nr:GNAT family N-acetyltransferase [Clostridium cavendishii]SHK26645.1 GNAT acetyltransferase [Clostridium cavendishii DSM 21758]
MIKLDSKEFKKITHLVKSQDELSVFSVINCENPGEIYVNNIDNPTSALIKTSECNLIAGNSNDEVFNSEVSSELDFWDQLVPDSCEWMDKIPTIHKNHFIRKYKRRHYVLFNDKFVDCNAPLKEGYILEKVDISFLRKNSFENSERILEILAENWSDDEKFKKYGTGYLIRNDKIIVSWSLSDCSFKKTIAIGIYTDERYRKNGFAKIAAAATIRDCFTKGYEKIDWLCVDSNKGSIATAEKLGFKIINQYYSFSSYPPIENLKDLSESEWHEWGEYLEDASKTEERLILECVYAYIKSNDVEKTINIMTNIKQKKIELDYLRFKNWIIKLQTYGICSNFTKNAWINFLDENIHLND